MAGAFHSGASCDPPEPLPPAQWIREVLTCPAMIAEPDDLPDTWEQWVASDPRHARDVAAYSPEQVERSRRYWTRTQERHRLALEARDRVVAELLAIQPDGWAWDRVTLLAVALAHVSLVSEAVHEELEDR